VTIPLRTSSSALDVTFDGPRPVVRIADPEFDSAADAAPGEHLYRLIEHVGCTELVLEFDNVRFVSSIGLTVLLTLNRQLRAVGGRLIIRNVHPPVCEIFAVTRLDTLLEVHAK
jgi:anti-anti-sigma factor